MPLDRFSGLAAVLDAIRTEKGITQPGLADRAGLGRSVVAERVLELEAAGLVVPAGLGPSTGGRAPKRLQLNARAGYVVGINIASNELVVVSSDLSGAILSTRQAQIDVTDGPKVVLDRVAELVDAVSAEGGSPGRLLAIGAGLPGPVAFDTGVPAAVPLMAAWDGYPVREHLSTRWKVPVWVDNRVNLLALGEMWSNPAAAAAKQMLYIGAGASIAAALIVDGRLYRGAHGLAGAIGHVAVPEAGISVCLCGKIGCLEALAGGAAIARHGRTLAESGQSKALARILEQTGIIRALDITVSARDGDPACRELLRRTASSLGGSLATLVSFFAPELVIIGGGLARAGDLALSPIRQAVQERLLPASAADLVIELSALDEEGGGAAGGAQLALGEIFSREQLPKLLEQQLAGAPATFAGV
ncbi:ROK family transcriptional regulator [Pseudarthrobacter sp. YAF2]|uniref:ROK family transcriptional regulator n=1 Tax=Pseudarthrobacter sp. YAF2 TaxID=3233078 RepID=UPI003F99F183